MLQLTGFRKKFVFIFLLLFELIKQAFDYRFRLIKLSQNHY